jgi:hypothetical protein
VSAFHRDLLREVQRKGYYESPLGVRRFIAQPWGAELERELLNEPPYPAPICLQMHDEFLAEVPEEDVELWAEKIKRVMERPVEELGGAVFPTEVKVGRNWAPEGLQELSAPR